MMFRSFQSRAGEVSFSGWGVPDSPDGPEYVATPRSLRTERTHVLLLMSGGEVGQTESARFAEEVWEGIVVV